MLKKLLNFVKARIKEPSTMIVGGLLSIFAPAMLPLMAVMGSNDVSPVDPATINPAENPVGAIVAGVLFLMAAAKSEGGSNE